MPGRPSLIRTVPLTITLPEDIHGKLSLYLYSESEQRIPKGAYQRLFVQLLNEFFNKPEVLNNDSRTDTETN